MKSFPVNTSSGYAFSVDEFAEQLGKTERLRATVRGVRRTESELVVSFAENVEQDIVEELVDVEQQTCPYIDIEYDAGTRTLTVGAWDAQGRAQLYELAELFEDA